MSSSREKAVIEKESKEAKSATMPDEASVALQKFDERTQKLQTELASRPEAREALNLRLQKSIADNQTAIVKLSERKIALDAKIVVLESEIALREKNAPVSMANMEAREKMAEN